MQVTFYTSHSTGGIMFDHLIVQTLQSPCGFILLNRQKMMTSFYQAKKRTYEKRYCTNLLFTCLMFVSPHVKPGSHMPPSYLPVLPGTPFQYENRSHQQQRLCQSLPPACRRSWLKFHFTGMLVVNACNVSCCQWGYVFIYQSTQVLSGTATAYENQA